MTAPRTLVIGCGNVLRGDDAADENRCSTGERSALLRLLMYSPSTRARSRRASFAG